MPERTQIHKVQETNSAAAAVRKVEAPSRAGFEAGYASQEWVSQEYGNQAVQCLFARLAAGGTAPARKIRTKLSVGEPDDLYEREADQIAEHVIAMSHSGGITASPFGEAEGRQAAVQAAPIHVTPLIQKDDEEEEKVQRREDKDEEDKTIQAAGAETEDSSFSDNIEEQWSQVRGGGQPLPDAPRQFMEDRFLADFSDVRVHSDSSAAQMSQSIQARAFTLGKCIAFAANQYAPDTHAGQKLLAHELTHVLQQTGTHKQNTHKTAQRIQRANTSDTRLPASQAEATTYAQAAKVEIDNAQASLAASTDQARQDIATLITQASMTLEALTPRHDSAAAAGQLQFFVGQTNYTAAPLTLSDQITYHVEHSGTNTFVRIRAREHTNIDNMLTNAEIEERLILAVSDVSYLLTVSTSTPTIFDRYRAQFNTLWNIAPFATMSVQFNPALGSRGPRTDKANAIFNHIYQRDVDIRSAYDANPPTSPTSPSAQEQMDTYTAPEGLNLPVSPRLQQMREVFFPYAVPIPSSSYATFRGQIQTVANTLELSERTAVEQSQDWQRLINIHITDEAQRQEIRTIIATPPPASTPTPVTLPTTPTPAPPTTTGATVTPQQFVDSITLVGPISPVLANYRREQVSLTPLSTVANPNVAIETRVTLTPPDRVQGSNISPNSVWPNGDVMSASFEPEVINTGTVTMTGHLDLLNGPAGLAPAVPVPDMTFTVQDERQNNLLATWTAYAGFDDGSGPQWFYPGTTTVRYLVGSTQNLRVQAWLPNGQTNPGLTLSLRARLKRVTTASPAGVVISATPDPMVPFPIDVQSSGAISFNITAPAPTGTPAVDNLIFEAELLDSTSAVISTQTINMPIQPEQTYNIGQATTVAAADHAYLNDRTPAGLLGKMQTAIGTAISPIAPSVVDAIEPLSPPIPPGHLISLRALTRRHDSAAFVNQVMGGAHPELVGYFLGPTYSALPSTANSFADVPAAGFGLPSFGPRVIGVNRTTDVATGQQRSDDDLIRFIVHEAVHAMDERPGPSDLIERYKTEFRAYWMDGRFGPPYQPGCPAPTTATTDLCPEVTPGCFDTAFRPDLPPPGPKSCRARAIFSQQLYGSVSYPWLKPAYDDDNPRGFREQVDSYLIPDGINLMVSVRLEELRSIIEAYTGTGFAALQTQVQGFMGIGTAPAPAVGVLTAAEKDEIHNNHAWRDLVNRKVTVTTDRNNLKTDLNIPQ